MQFGVKYLKSFIFKFSYFLQQHLETSDICMPLVQVSPSLLKFLNNSHARSDQNKIIKKIDILRTIELGMLTWYDSTVSILHTILTDS